MGGQRIELARNDKPSMVIVKGGGASVHRYIMRIHEPAWGKRKDGERKGARKECGKLNLELQLRPACGISSGGLGELLKS